MATRFAKLLEMLKQLIGYAQVHPTLKWLWNFNCQEKHKVFCWLLLKDRLRTRNILWQKSMVLDSYNCVLCDLQNNNLDKQKWTHFLRATTNSRWLLFHFRKGTRPASASSENKHEQHLEEWLTCFAQICVMFLLSFVSFFLSLEFCLQKLLLLL